VPRASGIEAIALEQDFQCGRVPRLQNQISRGPIQLDIRADRGQSSVERQARQRGAQVFANLAADLRHVVHDALQTAEFSQPLGRRLGAAFFNARNVVDAVAHQGQIVDDLIGTHAEFLDDTGFIQRAAAHRVDQTNAWSHELGEVLVAGGYGDLDALRCRLDR
jgi:hypothetical protein